LRRLLPAWEVYSPGIDEPDLGVRGAGRMWEASWAPVVKVLPRVLARNTAAAGTPDAGHGWSGPGKRGWATRQGLDLGGSVGPLSVQGDELARQVGQHHASDVGAGDYQ